MPPDQTHIIAMRSCATRQCGVVSFSRLDLRGWKTEGAKADMALEIRFSDYGDIETGIEFPRARPRLRADTAGAGRWAFLITGRRPIRSSSTPATAPIRSLETLGMRGLQFHENMIENQLRAPWAYRLGDRPASFATPICHIRPRRQGTICFR